MKPTRLLLIFVLAGLTCSSAELDSYVLVRGGVLPDNPQIRVDDFEILAQPVTNRQYKLFVDAAGHAPPQHWQGGRIPAGWENHPVIFVNRFDVEAYLKWLSRRDKRVYRLPTRAEFEYAARAGVAGATYAWGNASPQGKVNYDESGNRAIHQWREHLQAVRRQPANPWGLFDMAGNVFQMVDSYPDLATMSFTYRVENLNERESGVAGGSWARAEYFLRNGVFGGVSAGIRRPDLGFRPVREPAGSTHFRRQNRRLVAAPAGGGPVYLGWQLLPEDAPATGFHVYRSLRRDAAGIRISSQPVTDSTNYVDREAPSSGRIYYRVRPVSADGKEGPPSEWSGVAAGATRSGLIAVFEPGVRQGGFLPVFGDLDGDGALDAVLKLDNGIREMSRDPGVPVELEAVTSYGKSIWRRPLVNHDQCFGNSNNVPVNVYDLDGDGKAEVIVRLQDDNTVYLAVLDGMTGKVLRQTPWTAMVSDFARSSTRIHMSIAYLDGKRPAIITQTGLYENEIIDAYDASLKKLWTYRSMGETSGSGSHHVDIADVDGDGVDEVFNGTMLLNADGTLRWSIYRDHPDIVSVNRILPGTRERQVYYVVESNLHAGVYVVDAKTGKMHWKVNREDDPRWVHGHTGWASDIWEGSPGIELMANRDGHTAKDLVLFSAEGRILMNPFPTGWRPVNWTGGRVRDLISGDGRRLGRFDGKGVMALDTPAPNESGGSCRMVADIAGDFRDEVVCEGKTQQGAPALFVYTNMEPISRREVTRTGKREYRLWMARNMGGGYASYYEWEP